MIDVKNHLNVLDNEGNKTNVIIPYADYQALMKLLDRFTYLDNFEHSLHESIDQMVAMKSGKQEKKSLKSLIDEL
ncbi:MAG: hypothetical protein AAF849_21325 [Bacteroidota bacterium]